jgi:dihydropteroate synthase
MLSINCKGKLIDFTTPKIMGILNLTPDSFYDGGRFANLEDISNQVNEMLINGASFIDIGGMSSRPGATIISAEEELNRVGKVITYLKDSFDDIIMSIDTVHAQVAKKAIELGVSIVNDISAGEIDSEMIESVAQLDVPYIAMHMKGTPTDMQKEQSDQSNPLNILKYLAKKERKCADAGIKDIILDPGFGFGKSLQQNYNLLSKLNVLRILERPILVGISRKSMIYKPLKINADNALNGTSAIHMLALLNGANILRVHDVKEAKEVIELFDLYQLSQQDD